MEGEAVEESMVEIRTYDSENRDDNHPAIPQLIHDDEAPNIISTTSSSKNEIIEVFLPTVQENNKGNDMLKTLVNNATPSLVNVASKVSSKPCIISTDVSSDSTTPISRSDVVSPLLDTFDDDTDVETNEIHSVNSCERTDGKVLGLIHTFPGKDNTECNLITIEKKDIKDMKYNKFNLEAITTRLEDRFDKASDDVSQVDNVAHDVKNAPFVTNSESVGSNCNHMNVNTTNVLKTIEKITRDQTQNPLHNCESGNVGSGNLSREGFQSYGERIKRNSDNDAQAQANNMSPKCDIKLNCIEQRRLFWQKRNETKISQHSNQDSSSTYNANTAGKKSKPYQRHISDFKPRSSIGKMYTSNVSKVSQSNEKDNKASQLRLVNEELNAKLKKRALRIKKETTDQYSLTSTMNKSLHSLPCESKAHEKEKCIVSKTKSTTRALSPCSKLQKDWIEKKSSSKETKGTEKAKVDQSEKKHVSTVKTRSQINGSTKNNFSQLMAKWSNSNNDASPHRVDTTIHKESLIKATLSPLSHRTKTSAKSSDSVKYGKEVPLSFLSDLLE